MRGRRPLADGALRVVRDAGGTFQDPPANTFLVKLSDWLGR